LIENEVLGALKKMVLMEDLSISRSAIRIIGNWAIQSATIRDLILSENTHEYIIGMNALFGLV
jgi:hypothetical protein